MAAHPPPTPPALIEVCQEGGRWRVQSTDRLFSGLFMDFRSARRHAEAEAEAHPGHLVVVRSRR